MSALGVDEAVRLLDEGDVVALPTDTVYGLAASLAHPEAIAALFALKGRPSSVALPVLVDSVATIESLGVELAGVARRFAQRYWPGALTLVVAAPSALASLVGGDATGTVGFRVPGDEKLLSLLALSGPLAVTSANAHGATPCHSAAEVLEAFDGRASFAGVVDGGWREGVVSTVVEVRGATWRVARHGAISEEDLASLAWGEPPVPLQ